MTRVNLPKSLGDADKLAGLFGGSLEVRAQRDADRQMLSEPDTAAELAWSLQPKR